MSAEELPQIIGHEFARRELFEEALTHPSALAPERRRRRCRPPVKRGYERLEFLGDRVLGLVVADYLWHRFEGEPEGDLTRRHTHLVRREALARVSETIGLGQYLVLSRTEAAAGTASNPGILADVCEALVGAVFLDGGYPAAAGLVEQLWGERLRTPAHRGERERVRRRSDGDHRRRRAQVVACPARWVADLAAC